MRAADGYGRNAREVFVLLFALTGGLLGFLLGALAFRVALGRCGPALFGLSGLGYFLIPCGYFLIPCGHLLLPFLLGFLFLSRLGRGGTAAPLRGLHRRDVRIGPVLLEDPHGVHVERIGGPPERRRALEVDAAAPEHAEGVLHVPEMAVQPHIGVRAGAQQRLEDIQVGGLLLLVLGGVGVGRPRRPLALDHGEQGRGPCTADQVRGGSAIEQLQCEVELAVDRGHEERGGLVAARGLIDVRSTIEQCRSRLGVPLSDRMQERGESAPGADLLRVGHGLWGGFGGGGVGGLGGGGVSGLGGDSVGGLRSTSLGLRGNGGVGSGRRAIGGFLLTLLVVVRRIGDVGATCAGSRATPRSPPEPGRASAASPSPRPPSP